MSMDQTKILNFLKQKGERLVVLDLDYSVIWGLKPKDVSTMVRNDPNLITGGYGVVNDVQKNKAHAGALRALVREKDVSIKVETVNGRQVIVAGAKTARGRVAAEAAPISRKQEVEATVTA